MRITSPFALKQLTGIFNDNRYFDVVAEYAKADPDDILIRVTVANRGPEPATLHLLPTLWYRNTWIWGCKHEGCWVRPTLKLASDGMVEGDHANFGRHFLLAEGAPRFLFTENETNMRRLFGVDNWTPYAKDAFHEYLIAGRTAAVNPKLTGTKLAAHYRLDVPAGDQVMVRLRLANTRSTGFSDFDRLFAERIREADEFFAARLPATLTAEEGNVVRRVMPGCCGQNSSTITLCATGSTAIRSSRLRPPAGSRAAMRSGNTSTTAT
jgi:hypothetical protein